MSNSKFRYEIGELFKLIRGDASDKGSGTIAAALITDIMRRGTSHRQVGERLFSFREEHRKKIGRNTDRAVIASISNSSF